MSTTDELNDVQAREYNRALALNLCLTEESKTIKLYPPFNEVAEAFFINTQTLVNLVPTKESNGGTITGNKATLKQTIATNANIICTRTTAYAVKIGDTDLQAAVYKSMSAILELKDADVVSFVTRLTGTVSPLLANEDFLPYAVTETMLNGLTTDATTYKNSIGKASFADSKSSAASDAIDKVLKAIRENIVQFNLLLNFFNDKYPAFVKEYLKAIAIDYSNIHHSGIKGIVINSATEQPVENVVIILKGKLKTKTIITGDDGVYHIISFRPGKCKLTITAPGHESQVVDVTIIRGKTLELNISLQSGVVGFNKTA